MSETRSTGGVSANSCGACTTPRPNRSRHSVPLPSPAVFPWWNFEALLDRAGPGLDHGAREGLEAAIDRHRRWHEFDEVVVCHGDVHPGNVLMTADGPVLIDWDLLCLAPPGWDHGPMLFVRRSVGRSAGGVRRVRTWLRSVARRRSDDDRHRRTPPGGGHAHASGGIDRRSPGTPGGRASTALLARRPRRPTLDPPVASEHDAPTPRLREDSDGPVHPNLRANVVVGAMPVRGTCGGSSASPSV